MANLLVNLESATSETASGTWADIPGLSATGITVAETDSVMLMFSTLALIKAADNTLEMRFTVDGSEVGSPVIRQFSDSATTNEVHSGTIAWAVDGLSAGTHSFAAQWRTVKGTCATDATRPRPRTFQVVEIPNGEAAIKVDQSANNATSSPASFATLLSQTGVSIAGTDSVIIMIGAIPLDLVSDASIDVQFSVDDVLEGAITSASTDSSNEGNDWSGMHVTDGLSAGTHSFELKWRDRLSGPSTDATPPQMLQVIEVTNNAVLKVDKTSSSSQSIPATFGDITDMTGTFTTAADALQLMVSNITIDTDGSDHTCDFSLSVDGVTEGAIFAVFTDDEDRVTNCLFARAKTGLSAASHDFSLEGDVTQRTPETDTTRPRTFAVIEFEEGASTVQVSKAVILKQNIASSVQKGAILKHNVIISILKGTILKHNVTTAISKAIILKHTIINAITKSSILKHNLMNAITKTSAIKHNLVNAIPKSLILKWNITSAVPKATILKHYLVNAIPKSVILKHNLIAAVPKPVILKGNIVNAIQKSVILKHNITTAIQKGIILKHNLINAISKTMILKHGIGGTVQKAIILKNNLIEAIQKGTILKQNISNSVQKATILKHNMIQAIQKATILKHNVESTLLAVQKSTILKQNISNAITKSSILKQNVLEYVTKSAILKHNVINAVQKNAILKHGLKNAISKSSILKQNIVQSITKTTILKHNVESTILSVQKSAILNHSIISAVQSNVILKHNIQDPVQKLLILKNNISTAITQNAILKHNLQTAISKSTILKHNVMSAIAKSLVLKQMIGGLSTKMIIFKHYLAQVFGIVNLGEFAVDDGGGGSTDLGTFTITGGK